MWWNFLRWFRSCAGQFDSARAQMEGNWPYGGTWKFKELKSFFKNPFSSYVCLIKVTGSSRKKNLLFNMWKFEFFLLVRHLSEMVPSGTSFCKFLKRLKYAQNIFKHKVITAYYQGLETSYFGYSHHFISQTWFSNLRYWSLNFVK